MNIQEILKNELNKVDKIKYKDDRDKHCREAMKEFLLPTIKLIIKAVEEVFGDEPVQCERYVDIKHLDLFIPIIGRIDFESNTKIMELKSLPPNFKKNKLGYGVSQQKMPERIKPEHLQQTSLYAREKGREAYVVYVSPNEYKIFKPSQKELNAAFNNMIEKAKRIQNLLDISNGDGRVMAQYVEQPDLDHWYYSDLTTKQKKLAREIWNIQ